VINRQKLAAPSLTKYSIVNPMAPTTTALESRSYPALKKIATSKSVLTMVLAPVTGREARPPDLAPQGTVQTSQSAVRTSAYVLPNPLAAGYARITTQHATDADPAETDNLGTSNNAANARTVSAHTALQPHALRARAQDALLSHAPRAHSRSRSHAQAAHSMHATRATTRNETRKVQFLDIARPDPASLTTIPIASPHKRAQGKRRKLMELAPWMRFHPFVATLEEWASGVSALCGEPWSDAAICAAIERGPHTSALTPEARDLIDDEMKYQIKAGFSELVLWRTIQHAYPTNLKVSPLAVIPQVGRRGRLLLDLSFTSQVARPASKRGRRNRIVPPPLAPSVNSTTTIQQSPDYPVKELGRVPPQLLAFMYCVPCKEVIMFAKINLSDAFWRMLVRESDKWNFVYVIPGAADETVRLIIPHALQMGWTESPGYFCAATKTGRDIM
jgi:hypothetical protein